MCSVCIAAPQALTLHHGRNHALLHGRRALEAVIVDTADELAFEGHFVERFDGFIIVGFDLSYEWR
jgi:hypothetical protein